MHVEFSGFAVLIPTEIPLLWIIQWAQRSWWTWGSTWGLSHCWVQRTPLERPCGSSIAIPRYVIQIIQSIYIYIHMWKGPLRIEWRALRISIYWHVTCACCEAQAWHNSQQQPRPSQNLNVVYRQAKQAVAEHTYRSSTVRNARAACLSLL